MTEPDESKPASEQFDLGESTESPEIDAEAIDDLSRELERVVGSELDVSKQTDESLAALVAACKRLENAAEDARKEVFESELDDRVESGQSVGPLTKANGTNRYVTDHAGAFDAVLDAGEDPREVAKVKASSLQDVLGQKADEFVGESSYSYFRRQS